VSPNVGIIGASFTSRSNYITANEDAIDPNGAGPYLIEYNKLYRDGTNFGTAHHDGIQFWGPGGNAVIRRNWISGWTTSAILIKTDLGPISHVTITENYLANPTGWFVLYVRDAHTGFGRPTFVDITNNKISSGGLGGSGSGSFAVSTGDDNRTAGLEATFCHTAAQRQAAIDGGNASAATWIVWSGNVWADGPNAGKEALPPASAVWL
jgi:hypothetical protein